MAEFCAEHVQEVLGLDPKSEEGQAWVVENGGICERCGYTYLQKE